MTSSTKSTDPGRKVTQDLSGNLRQGDRVPPAFFDAQHAPDKVFPPSWHFEVRERAGRCPSDVRYDLHATHGQQDIRIGSFMMEELAAGLRDSLRDIEGFGGPLPLLMAMTPTGPVEWTFGLWSMFHSAGDPAERLWTLSYNDHEVAHLRGVGGMIPTLLFINLGHHDPEMPKKWEAGYDRVCREEYFEKYTEHPIEERLFRFLHQLEAETGKNLFELTDIDEIQFAAESWRGRELPSTDPDEAA